MILIEHAVLIEPEVSIEPAVLIEPAVFIEHAILIEPLKTNGQLFFTKPWRLSNRREFSTNLTRFIRWDGRPTCYYVHMFREAAKKGSFLNGRAIKD